MCLDTCTLQEGRSPKFGIFLGVKTTCTPSGTADAIDSSGNEFKARISKLLRNVRKT